MMQKINFLLVVLFSLGIQANVRLPKLFNDNMVLQRNKPIPVWGWAAPHEKIQLRFKGQIKTTQADANGKWAVKLAPEKEGGPYELVVKGKNEIKLTNVLVGEVWICSGQSNMAFTVNEVIRAKEEISKATNPLIRHFTVARAVSSLPKEEVKGGEWKECTTATVGDFSAVGYFFAKAVYEKTKIPIGLITTAWGGTVVETWTSREAFESSDEFKGMIADMPRVDLDSIAAIFIASTSKRVEQLQGNPIDFKNENQFKNTDFDDATWPRIHEPEVWESQALGEFDGVVWLRKTIELPSNFSSKAAVLDLGKIDDEDRTYINGIAVGQNANWDAQRHYIIPAGILKAGKNVIAIRVVDNGGGGGMYSEAAEVKLTVDETVFPLNGSWKYQVAAIKSEVGPNSYPSLLFNAMVNPLIPYSFQGVLWYQGESNASRAFQYKKAFPLLIQDWRNKWGQGNFPFYFVQLSSFNEANGNSNNGSTWAELRESQTETLALPNTGMCVTTDIGNPIDIHPTNKQEVGKRLAAIALQQLYGQGLVSSGPIFKSMDIEGSQMVLSFDAIGRGLKTSDKYGAVKGFELAGEDHIFQYATAFIKDNKVILFSDKVVRPIAVRFGWADDASDCNLYNEEGFPAIPFRTDSWKTITENATYKIVK
jgi:sialate O-acetylesterase